jgi:hypothetical protein
MGFFQPSGILNRRGFFGESAAAPFNPASISGLALWLKADAGVTQSGGLVTQWNDQSGNAQNFSGFDDIFLDSNSQNGLAGLRFEQGYFSSNNSFFNLNFDVNFSIFAVAKANSGTLNPQENPAVRWLLGRGVSNDFGAGFTFGAYGNPHYNFAGLVSRAGVSDLNLESGIISGTEISLNRLTNQNSITTFSKNGQTQGSFDLIEEGYTDLTTSSLGWTIGGQDFNGGVFFRGSFIIYEILFYSGTLSANDITSVTNYLNQRWSIYS